MLVAQTTMKHYLRFTILLTLFVFAFVSVDAQDTGDTHRVIVALDVVTDGRSIQNNTQMIQRAGDAILNSFASAEVRHVTRFSYIPYIALELTDAGYRRLRSVRSDVQIFNDDYAAPMLNGAVTQIGVDGVGGAWEMGYTGKGQVIAVLDSGVDYFHPALAGKIIDEACFSSSGTIEDRNGHLSDVTPTCPNGQQTAIGLYSALNCSSEIANCDHGTLTTGTIASENTAYHGIAPDARIMAVQIFSRVDGDACPVDWGFESPCVLALVSDQIRALEYVYSKRDQYNIAAVSMSLGAGAWSNVAQCDVDNAPQKAIVDLLASVDIPVIAPTGNAGYHDQMIAPACISSVVAVSAVDDKDKIPAFANTTTFMDFFAPGNNIHSTTIGGLFADKSGTSMATPFVAGAFAILKDANADMNSQQVLKALRRNGVPIAHNGKTSPRIDVKSALIATAVRQNLPATMATVNTYPMSFSWHVIPETEVTRYKLIVFNTKTGEKSRRVVMPSECGALCTVALNVALPEGSVHEWKVKAVLPASKRTSNKRPLMTNYPENFTLIAPAMDTVLDSPQALNAFSWQALIHGSKYKIVLKNATTREKLMASAITCTPLSPCSLSVPADVQNRLVSGQRYFWKLKIRLNDGRLIKSTKQFFSTDFTPQLFRQSQ